jgi:hypothetical protein
MADHTGAASSRSSALDLLVDYLIEVGLPGINRALQFNRIGHAIGSVLIVTVCNQQPSWRLRLSEKLAA